MASLAGKTREHDGIECPEQAVSAPSQTTTNNPRSNQPTESMKTMKLVKSTKWSILAPLLMATSALTIHPGTIRAQTPNFNPIVFEEEIRKEFHGKAKGYSFVIANANGFQARVSGGHAQGKSDGNVAMTTNVRSCIGSITKMLSGTALLNLLENRKVMNASVSRQLDTPIWLYLPDKWRREYRGKNLEKITLPSSPPTQERLPPRRQACAGQLERQSCQLRP